MKNVIRFSALIMFAAVVGFSSCVKNEVSDEVKAIRQAQVTKLNADAAFMAAKVIGQNLDNANQELMNAKQSIENALATAMNALDVQQATALLEVTLADYEAQIAQAEADLLAAQLTQAQNQDAYAEYLANGNFEKLVGEYYTKYVAATGVLNLLYADRIAKQKEIAMQEILLASTTKLDAVPPKTGHDLWDFQLSLLEDQLADAIADKAGAEAALEAYQAVLADPTTAEGELLAAGTIVDEMNTANLLLNIDKAKLEVELGTQGTDYDAAVANVKKGAGLQDVLDKTKDSLVVANADLVKAKAGLDSLRKLDKYATIKKLVDDVAAQQIVVDDANALLLKEIGANYAGAIAINDLDNKYLKAVYAAQVKDVYANTVLNNDWSILTHMVGTPPKNTAYTLAGGVSSVVTLTINSACAAAGTIVITLNGDPYGKNIDAGTTAQVAAQLRGQVFAGYVLTGTGSDVIFTGASTGAQTGSFSFDLGTATGASGSFVTSVVGIAGAVDWGFADFRTAIAAAVAAKQAWIDAVDAQKSYVAGMEMIFNNEQAILIDLKGQLVQAEQGELAPEELADAWDAIAGLEEDIVDFKADVKAAQKKVDDFASDYAKAIAKAAELKPIVDPLRAAIKVITDEQDDNNQMKTDMAKVEAALQAYIDDIYGADEGFDLEQHVEDLQDVIADLADDIIDLEYDIAAHAVNRAEAEAKLDELKVELEQTDSRIVQQEAVANYWKALMDALIAGK